jgi:uncharacterized damage-inducible protein DinB
MNSRANRLEALLAGHRLAVDEFLARARQVSSARWNTARAPGKWSPAQEVKHVVLAYEAFIRDLEGGESMRLVGTPLKRALWRAVGLTSIVWLKKIPRGARAPRESRPPEAAMDQGELLAQLREQTDRFEAIFRETWDRDATRRVVHPYFGSLDLSDGMTMCTVHTRHHAAVLPSPDPRTPVDS